jgi:hypothetical protein
MINLLKLDIGWILWGVICGIIKGGMDDVIFGIKIAALIAIFFNLWIGITNSENNIDSRGWLFSNRFLDFKKGGDDGK